MGYQQEENPYQKSARAGSHRRWPCRFSLLSFRLYATYRFLFFAALVGTFYLVDAHRSSKASLEAKYRPTYFVSLHSSNLSEAGGLPWEANLDDDALNGSGRDMWQHRADWTPLSSGFEGATFLYKSSVIKTFKTKQSPLRNCLPANVSTALAPVPRRWPSEIPASLLLGGLSAGDGEERRPAVPDNVDFVPVRDYFLAPASETGPATWHLVSPFLESGHLYKLAKRLSASPTPLSARVLDQRFRPSLKKLLLALESMHNGYDLCHDDIKPDNIFVTSHASSNNSDAAADTHWLLADLGNVRQTSHAYHSSQLWGPKNGQLVDCRSNDVVRLMKSYVKFLQLASSRAGPDDEAGTPVHDFNRKFLRGTEPWSRLYWSVLADHATGAGAVTTPVAGSEAAAAALERCRQHAPHEGAGGGNGGSPGVPGRTAAAASRHWWRLETIVNRELNKGMRNSEKWTRWLGGPPRDRQWRLTTSCTQHHFFCIEAWVIDLPPQLLLGLLVQESKGVG